MAKEKSEVLTTQEACKYLRISRPTFLKMIYTRQIKARKVGRGWKILRSELQAFMKAELRTAGRIIRRQVVEYRVN